jgi:acid phosphatase class B
MKITTSITYYSSMYEISDSDVVIHLCTFEAYFYKAKVNLRFPSLFFVEWKSMNSKNSVAMIGRKRAINSNIDLDETLLFTTEMIFHRGQGQYLKKESLIHLNLISSSRPDEVKLVGRVVIDLSNIANNKIQ